MDLAWDPALYALSYTIETMPPTTTLTTSDTFTRFTGLSPDTFYTFIITPSNATGNGSPTASVPTSTVTPIPPFGPGIFTTFTDVTKTTIGLSWYDDVPYARSYNVYAYTYISDVLVGVQPALASPYIFTGLQPNYSYYFQITAVNATGESDPGPACVAVGTVPEVTGVSVGNPTENTIDLTWDAPTTNLQLSDFIWTITSTPETSSQQISGTTSYTFTGLTPETEYTFTVTPQVAYSYLAGDPVTSDPISTLAAPIPDAVTYFVASNPSPITVDLAWDPVIYAASYSIESSSPSIILTTSDTFMTFTGLIPGTEYTFTITPSNVYGNNGPPTTSDPISTLPLPVPDAVTNFAPSNPTDTTVDLTWDSALYASSYSIESSPASGTMTTSDTFITFMELTPDTEYTFTITPSNTTGNGPPTTSDPISTLLPLPGPGPAPYNTFTDLTTTTIGVSWTNGVTQYATSYNVYAYVAYPEVVVGFQNTIGSPYIYTGLQPNYAYVFKITGVNATGEGDPGAGSITAWTVPEVTGFSASNPQETTVDLTWDAPDMSVVNNIQWEITSTPTTSTQTASAYNSFPIPYTFTGLTPDTSYTFTITPQVGIDFLAGDPVTSDPISTLLPLPGYGNDITVSNVTATTMDLSWDPTDYAASYNLYEFWFGLGPISVTGTTYTWTGLTPDTGYSFYLIPVNATGSGVQSTPTAAENTLIQLNLAYTGTIETLVLRPGNYRFQMAGGSGPLRVPFEGGGRCFAEYTFDYTVENTITIQYAIGQASPGDVGGAGGTYMYNLTNSQWLFIAGGAGSNDFSPNPSENAPGDGSGGAAGDGGGSGAGVNSNGSASTVSAGSGGLTFGNGGTGGAAGTFGEPQFGGFGGGGGGTRVYDPALSVFYGEYAYYPGGGGGYTGGTTTTTYIPEHSAAWASTPGTSYMISGSTFWGYKTYQGSAPVTNGYININP